MSEVVAIDQHGAAGLEAGDQTQQGQQAPPATGEEAHSDLHLVGDRALTHQDRCLPERIRED